MGYYKCPKCEGVGTICAGCGAARIPKRFRHSNLHDGHLAAKIIKCPAHQESWYNCDCCGKEHVDAQHYLWARDVFPRELRATYSGPGIGYCGPCATFIRERLEVAFDEAIEKIQVVGR